MDIFEKMGIECEWIDEWDSCFECARLVRTVGDCWTWQPSFKFVESDGALCHICIKEDVKAYLAELEGDFKSCNTISDINLENYGYVKYNKDPYESGLHLGQKDSPETIAELLQSKNIKRFLFQLDDNSQFYSRWSVYIHSSEANNIAIERSEELPFTD